MKPLTPNLKSFIFLRVRGEGGAGGTLERRRQVDNRVFGNTTSQNERQKVLSNLKSCFFFLMGCEEKKKTNFGMRGKKKGTA